MKCAIAFYEHNDMFRRCTLFVNEEMYGNFIICEKKDCVVAKKQLE